MATIDATLDSFLIPALPSYANEFGTKKESGGLSTAECVDVTGLPFTRQRPFAVTEDSDTSTIEAHSCFRLDTAGLTLTLSDAAFEGCTARVVNASGGAASIAGTGFAGTLAAGTEAVLAFRGGEWLFEAGDGYLANGCFHVWTVAGLLAWNAYMDAAEDYSIDCVLHNSLDMTGVEWTPVADYVNTSQTYTGTFDGGGHSLHNLTIELTTQYTGFISYLGSGGEVRNLHLVGGSVSGGNYTGGIVGHVYSCTVSSCTNSGSVSGGNYTGGIAGYVYTSCTVSGCSNSGAVTGGISTGGIAGSAISSSITGCTNSGNVSGSTALDYAGGIAGSASSSSITSCTNSGNVSGSYGAGGIVGLMGTTTSGGDYCAVSCCANSGTVTGTRAGYIAGHRFSSSYDLCQYNTRVAGPTSEVGYTGS